MRKYRDLDKKINIAIGNSQKATDNLINASTEFIEVNEKRLETIQNIDSVVNKIDKEFGQKTSILNSKDQIFLWTAVALQTLRWVLLPEFKIDDIKPNFDDREKASEGGKRERNEQKDYLEKNSDKESKENNKYLNWEDYYKNPVPYDAMNGEGALNIEIGEVTKRGKNLTGKNHHAATLGHDPVLGYFFGTMNIMTSTITFNKILFPTNEVISKTHTVGAAVGFIPTLIEMIEAESEDSFRVPAALARQAIHMASDEMTKMGLPIPMISADAQQRLLKQGWNSKELKRIGESLKKHWKENVGIVALQFVLSLIINMIIQTIHILMFNEEKDVDMDLYKVRTHKILAVSEIIAESLNIIYVGGMVVVGLNTDKTDTIKHGLGKIDIGGYIEAVHQIVSNTVLQEKIRHEFVEQKLCEKLDAEHEWSFLEEEDE